MPERRPVVKANRERSMAIIGAGVTGLTAGGLLAGSAGYPGLWHFVVHQGRSHPEG